MVTLTNMVRKKKKQQVEEVSPNHPPGHPLPPPTRRRKGEKGPVAQSLSALPFKVQLLLIKWNLLSSSEAEKVVRYTPLKPVDQNLFLRQTKLKKRYPVLYRIEWQLLNKLETHSCRHATKPANEIKNRNRKIVPYDYNRVVLEPLFGIPDTDYINASYVDSILKPNAYIITQGPNEKTINDLWRMIWQEKVPCVIMLTKTFDFIKVMCNQYWPKYPVETTEHYGMIQVTVEKEEPLAAFVVRTLKLKKGGEERHLLHWHYTGWPSHCCPHANALLEFRRRIKTYLSTSPNPGSVVVHCNDGAGRSGVFVAIDANLQYADEDGMFDVYNYVKKLKASRKGLIEDLDQYKFIYEVLEEYVTCGHSWFAVREIAQQMKAKAQKRGMKRQNDYQKEYQQVLKATSKFTIGDCAGGHRLENRDKNRDIVTVPPDNCRPYLSSFQGNDFTDFINAVVVDGYMRTKEYIVAEWPMKHTVSDFWSLVYDHDCNSVVILCNPNPSDKKEKKDPDVDDSNEIIEVIIRPKGGKGAKNNPNEKKQYPAFWPQGSKSVKYGPIFTIDLVSSNHYPNVKTWIFRINKKVVSLTELMAGVKAETKTVQFFQFMCWPMGHKVPTSTNALVELMNMVERWRQRTGFGPIVVVSNNGRSRAGVFCAANSAIEQVAKHCEVDVFQCVKTVRRNRPQLVENMTEYKYCYDLVFHYVFQHNPSLIKE